MFYTPNHHTSSLLKIAAALGDVYPWRDNAIAEELQVPGTMPLEGRCLLVQLVSEVSPLYPGGLSHPTLPYWVHLLRPDNHPATQAHAALHPSEAECDPCVFAIPHYYRPEPPGMKQALSVDQYSQQPIGHPGP